MEQGNIDKNTEIPDTNLKKSSRPTLSVDVDYFQTYLDDADIPDSKKRELVETVWNISVSFVDLGFGLNPVQQATQEKPKHAPELNSPSLDSMQDSILGKAFGASDKKDLHTKRS